MDEKKGWSERYRKRPNCKDHVEGSPRESHCGYGVLKSYFSGDVTDAEDGTIVTKKRGGMVDFYNRKSIKTGLNGGLDPLPEQVSNHMPSCYKKERERNITCSRALQ